MKVFNDCFVKILLDLKLIISMVRSIYFLPLIHWIPITTVYRNTTKLFGLQNLYYLETVRSILRADIY